VYRRQGAVRGFEVARSVVDPRGHFELHVAPGELEVSASATGWAPSKPMPLDAKPGMSPVTLVVTAGATLRGTVVDAATHQGLAYARVMREGLGGGASAQPSNAGTVTRTDGTFELTGLPPGPTAITIGAGEYHPRIEGGLVAEDGGTIGPITIALTKLAPGEQPTLELVGIGVQLSGVDDGLRIEKVFPNSGAAAAGVVAGDLVVAVDGASAVELGVTGAIGRIRGVAGSTVTLTLRRDNQLVPVVIERRPIKT
jgi:hypothetical protein